MAARTADPCSIRPGSRLSEAPSGTDWKPLTAGRFGLVNLNSFAARLAHLAPHGSDLFDNAGQTGPARLAWPCLGVRQWQARYPRKSSTSPTTNGAYLTVDSRLKMAASAFLRKKAPTRLPLCSTAPSTMTALPSTTTVGSHPRFQNTQGLQLSSSKNNRSAGHFWKTSPS